MKCLTNNRCQAGSLFFVSVSCMVMAWLAVPRDGVGAGSALPCHYVRAGACDADGGCVHAARGRCSRPCPAAAPPTTTASTTRPRLSRRRPRGSRNEREPIGSRPMPCISRANGPSFIMELGTPTGTGHRHHVVCGSRAADRPFGPQKYWHIHWARRLIYAQRSHSLSDSACVP